MLECCGSEPRSKLNVGALARNARSKGACEPTPGRLQCGMTAVQIIEEIKRLPREEQTRVIEFARQVGENRLLTPEELGQLAKRMVEAKDPAEADRLQEQIERGFYGGPPHA